MGTIADKLNNIIECKADIKSAIEEKGLVVGDAPLVDYADKIRAIETGGDPEPEEYLDDVIFIDYDGKVLHRYTSQEFLLLTELPQNPIHEGLTSQGWNWTLEEAKNYVTLYGKQTIGLVYITDDEKSRFYITLDKQEYLSPTFNFYQQYSENAIIDWGDGSNVETVSGNNYVSVTHTYPNVGDYVITVEVTRGVWRPGVGLTKYFVSSSDRNDINYCDIIRKIHFGSGVDSINFYAFAENTKLSVVTFPNGCKTNGNYTFSNTGVSVIITPRGQTGTGYLSYCYCSKLKVFSFPGNLPGTYYNTLLNYTDIRRLELPIPSTLCSMTQMAAYCINLQSIIIPEGVSPRINSIVNGCKRLRNLIIPSTVTIISSSGRGCEILEYLNIGSGITSIESYSFRDSILLKSIYIQASTPPTITSTSFPATMNCTIYVPVGSLSAYQNAQYWSDYASLMVEYDYSNE